MQKALMVRFGTTLVLALAGLQLACRAPDPQEELELLSLETYWAVDPSRGGVNYIAPVARFQLRIKGTGSYRSIQAIGTFRRDGNEWGSAWQRVGPSDRAMQPGEQTLVVLKSDTRYKSPDSPETMLAHEAFVDPTVEVFLRVGGSGPVKFVDAPVERRIGTREVTLGTLAAEEPTPSSEE